MYKSALIFSVIVSLLFAESPLLLIDGVGTKAQGMGNNYTAIANDYSAVFWNPSGLAFVPVREIHTGMNIVGMSTETELGGTENSYRKSRFRFSSAGLVRSIPTTQGGFAFALGYSSPYTFMDISKFRGVDVYNDPAPDSVLSNGNGNYLRYGDSLWYDESKSVSNGAMGMWSAAAGWQIAKGFGFGVTASYLNGRQMNHRSFYTHNIRGIFDRETDIATETEYYGFDLRIGAMYQPNTFLSAGARIEIPQVIRYKTSQRYAGDNLVVKSDGILRSSMGSALGLVVTLPFVKVAADAAVRSPNPDVDEGDLAYWKIGAGVGVEIPVNVLNALIRAGYSWKEYDLYPYADYVDDMLESDVNVDVNGSDLHRFNLGTTLVLSKNVTLDFAYTTMFFNTQSVDTDWRNVLDKRYSVNRFDCVLSVRY
jgi:hypothetical protein